MRSTTTRAAAAMIATVGALALVTPSALAATDGVDAAAKKGKLSWGVKESFRAYIEGPIADGGIEVTKPAKRLQDGTFQWAKGKGQVDAAADTASIGFKGSVYFYGHDTGEGPALEVTVADLRVIIDGDDSVLVADVTSNDFETGESIFYDDVELVDIDATGVDIKAGKKVKVNDLPTTLTAAGSQAFMGFYPAGSAFDLLSFSAKVKG